MSATRSIIFGAALALSVVAVGCSRGSEDAGREVDETVDVWVDQNGPFACPPEGSITLSSPPVCAAGPFDRVRLSGHPLLAFLSEAGWQQPSLEGHWIGTARIVGRSVEDGRIIELESIERG